MGDRVKERLGELLPKFKRKINKELEEKNKTLSDNPALLQLYKDLVITQIITAEVLAKPRSRVREQKSSGETRSWSCRLIPRRDQASGRWGQWFEIQSHPRHNRVHIQDLSSCREGAH